MNALTINATEFSRGLSEFLNKVQYTGQVLNIERGKRIIAQISPVPAFAIAAGFPIAQLDVLLGKNALPTDERLAMAQDLRTLRATLGAKADPWAL